MHITVMHLFGFGRRALHHHLARLGFASQIVRASPPSQADPYGRNGARASRVRHFLKVFDQGMHQLITWFGLDREGLGLSLEVRAFKVAEAGRM